MKSGDPGTCAPCVFQRLRQVGKGLTANSPLPSGSRSLKAEFRASTRTPDYVSIAYELSFIFSAGPAGSRPAIFGGGLELSVLQVVDNQLCVRRVIPGLGKPIAGKDMALVL